MAEHTDIPRTNVSTSAACGQWETLLADALDGLLRPEDEATFSAHMAVCGHCTALFDEARRGREWLTFLSVAPEVPEGLLDKILAQTGPGHRAGQAVMAGGHVAGMPMLPAWQHPGFMGYVRRFAEPRLMMTAAMAFFSIALTLNLTGIKVTQLRLADFRPAAVRSTLERRINMASVPIVRYYDHLSFVYEVESRMRELRGDTEGDSRYDNNQHQSQPGGAGESKQNQKDGGSRVDPPLQSVTPAANQFNDYLETSLRIQGRNSFPARLRWVRESAPFGGSALRVRERSSKWTA